MSNVSQPQIQPPEPPPFRPTIRLYPYQWIAIPLLFAIPILALLGYFGETRGEASTHADGITLTVQYPSRALYEQLQDISIRVQADQPLEAVIVAVDRAYLDAFTNVSFTPGAARITADAVEIDLGDVPAGEERRVSVQISGVLAGAHEGPVRVSAGEASAAVIIDTFVIP